MTLTREVIEAASGRELDALLYRALHPDRTLPTNEALIDYAMDAEGIVYTIPAYSTSGDAMLTVLEKMRERRIYTSMQPRRGGGWVADCDHEPEAACTYAKPISFSQGKSLPEAVCRAALLAILAQKKSHEN